MNVSNKYVWTKFIPLLGIIVCLIDTSHDGVFWEKMYIYYHIVVFGLIVMIFKI